MPELPKRKQIRLKDYDYSQNGYYFITICTQGRKCVLCEIVGAGFHARLFPNFHATPNVELKHIGKEIQNTIQYINDNYNYVKIDNYIIMPNHIHLIIILQNPQMGGHGNPPLQNVVGQLKSFTTKKYNNVLWQRGYYEHIIRNEQEYLKICEYIENNPQKWEEDKYWTIYIMVD